MIKTKKANNIEFEVLEDNHVLRELYRLPVTYNIFKDVCLHLRWAVKYRKTVETVKLSQIDFVVIGPTGLFVIEAKEWSEKILKEQSHLPLKEADKAGLVFYIKIINRFCKKFPIYNVAVMLHKVSKIKYEYVRHLTLRELYWFIIRREGTVSKKKITKITRWLSKVSKRKAIIRLRSSIFG